jgi:hypothetical protein
MREVRNREAAVADSNEGGMTAACGIQDLAVYDELRLPAGSRALTEVAEGENLRQSARAVLRDWAGRCGR